MIYINEVGQAIAPGDRVAYTYSNGTWKPLVGEFMGLTYSGQVRIKSETEKDRLIRRTWDGKVFTTAYPRAWVRRPGTHYIHKNTGVLIDYNKFYLLPYSERLNWEMDTEGRLHGSYESFEIPAVRTGPAGLKRTFKLS
jgi:hypothetical protein